MTSSKSSTTPQSTFSSSNSSFIPMRPAPTKPSMQSYRVLSSSPINHSRPSGGIDSDDEDNVFPNASARSSLPPSRSHSTAHNPFSAPADVYGDERVNNELLEEICNEIGIRDVVDIDQLVYNFPSSVPYYPNPASLPNANTQQFPQGVQPNSFRVPLAKGQTSGTSRPVDGHMDNSSSASAADHSQNQSGLSGTGAEGSSEFTDMELLHQLIFYGEPGGPPLPESQSSPLNQIEGFQPLLQPSGAAPPQTQSQPVGQGLNPFSYYGGSMSMSSAWNANASNTSGYFSWQQPSVSVSGAGAGAGAGAAAGSGSGAAYPSNPSPSEMPMYDYSNYELYYSRMMNKRLMSASAEPSAPGSPKKLRVRNAGADGAPAAGGAPPERTSPGGSARGGATAPADASASFSSPDASAVRVKNEVKREESALESSCNSDEHSQQRLHPNATAAATVNASASASASDSDPSSARPPPAGASASTPTPMCQQQRALPSNVSNGTTSKSISQNSSPLQARRNQAADGAPGPVDGDGEASSFGPLKSSGSLGSRPSAQPAATAAGAPPGQPGTRVRI